MGYIGKASFRRLWPSRYPGVFDPDPFSQPAQSDLEKVVELEQGMSKISYIRLFMTSHLLRSNECLKTKLNGNNLQHKDGRGRDGLREKSPLRSQIGLSLEESRLRQTSLLVPVTRNVAKCAAQSLRRAGHDTVRHFCDRLGRCARHSQGRLHMLQSQERDNQGEGVALL